MMSLRLIKFEDLREMFTLLQKNGINYFSHLFYAIYMTSLAQQKSLFDATRDCHCY